MASIDDYVKGCVSKYGLFVFEIKQFYSDELIARAEFVERFQVQHGIYKGYLFWGQHLAVDNGFEPHGFGIMIHESKKQMQLGCFKKGDEAGLQRIIQAQPATGRYFSQFTSLDKKLNGAAILEQADGTLEQGEYGNDRKVGVWQVKKPNG